MPHITVPDDNDPREQYTIVGATTGPFAINFPFFDKTDLDVVKTVSGVDTPLVLDTDYTITPDVTYQGGYQSGSLTLTPALSNCKLTITRDVPYGRGADQAAGKWDPSAANTEWDRIYTLLQQLRGMLGRVPRLADSVDLTMFDTLLPTPTGDQFLRWNSTGTQLINSSFATTGAESFPLAINRGGTGSSVRATAIANLLADSAEMLSTDAGSAANPIFGAYRNSASPAANDFGPAYEWRQMGSAKRVGHDMTLQMTKATNPEEFRMRHRVYYGAGGLQETFWEGQGLWTPNAVGADKGRDTINVKAAYADGALIGAGFINGWQMVNGPGDTTNDITVTPGAGASLAESAWLSTTVDIVKQLDVVFAEYSNPATPSGGREATSAAPAAGIEWWDVYMIGGPGKNTQPILTKNGPTFPMPSGFTERRLIGSIQWGTIFISPFLQKDDHFNWTNGAPLDINAVVVGTTWLTSTMSVPPGRKIWLNLYASAQAAAARQVKFLDPDGTVGGVPDTFGADINTITTNIGIVNKWMWTDSNAQISYASSAATTTVNGRTMGYRDPRGRKVV